jgi:hypothetical protein
MSELQAPKTKGNAMERPYPIWICVCYPVCVMFKEAIMPFLL